MRFLLLAAALLLSGAPAGAEQSAQPVPVALKSFALVEGDVVRLGDLFDGLGPLAETAIGRAPALGSRIELNSRWLAAVAQGYGIAWRPSSGFDHILVERASTTIRADRIEDVLRDGLMEQGLDANTSLLLDNPGLQLLVPSEVEPSLALAGLAYDPGSGRFNARVVAPAKGTPQARAVVTGRAVAMTDLPVLQRQVAPGEVIGPADIAWISTRADRLGRNVVVDAAALVGMSPRRPIPLEQPVRRGDLREPVTVKKSSLVTIRLETPRMVLTAQGRALEDGASGGVIRVMNTKSNTIVNAVVIDPGTVAVQPAGDLVTD